MFVMPTEMVLSLQQGNRSGRSLFRARRSCG